MATPAGTARLFLDAPDWVISTNTEHWNEALAARTGLRIATPLAFLSTLRSPDEK